MTLLRHHLAHTWRLGAGAAAGMFVFYWLAMHVFKGLVLPIGVGAIAARLPKPLLSALGIDELPIDSVRGYLAVHAQHPFVLMVLMAVPVAMCTGLLTGDVERRTLALVLVRRVRRAGVVGSAASVCALWLALGVASGLAGTVAGARMAGVADLPGIRVLLGIAASQYLLMLAVEGIALVFSAAASERSEAVAWTLVVVLIMYVWNFIAQFWPVAQPVARWMLFHYFEPKSVLLSGGLDARPAAVLGAVAAAGFLVAVAVFTRREFNI